MLSQLIKSLDKFYRNVRQCIYLPKIPAKIPPLFWYLRVEHLKCLQLKFEWNRRVQAQMEQVNALFIESTECFIAYSFIFYHFICIHRCPFTSIWGKWHFSCVCFFFSKKRETKTDTTWFTWNSLTLCDRVALQIRLINYIYWNWAMKHLRLSHDTQSKKAIAPMWKDRFYCIFHLNASIQLSSLVRRLISLVKSIFKGKDYYAQKFNALFKTLNTSGQTTYISFIEWIP